MHESRSKKSSLSAGELARQLGAELEGDARLTISGLASPERAAAGDLIYVDAPRHAERARNSAAKCVLAPAGLRLPGKTLLFVPEPKFAFAKAAALLLAPPEIAKGVHPTAIVAPGVRLSPRVSLGPHAVIEENVEIGDDTQIGAFCFIGSGASVGAACRLHPRVTLYPGARLGNHVEVHSGAVIGGDGFGYVFGEGRHWKFPQIGGVEIGDDVEIGCNTTIDRGALDATVIAAGTKIDNLVQVAHNVRIGEHSIVAAQTGISGSTTLGKNVVVGGQVGIGDHCTLEDGAMVASQAGILTGKTIHPGQIFWGTPARPLDRFKEQYGWLARLPQLAERVRRLEGGKVDD